MSADFVWNESQAEQIRINSERAMKNQAANMRNTIGAYNNIITNLDSRASVQEHISRTAMKPETRTDSDGNSYTVMVPDMPKRAAAAANARDLRSQSAALGRSNADLNNAINTLESAITSTNTLFRQYRDQAQFTDFSHATRTSNASDEIQSYIDRMTALYDSFNDSFPLTSPQSWLAALRNFIKSLVMNAIDALRMAGLQTACAFGGDPVNMATGNFVYEKNDLVIPGRFPLEFKRFYNSIGSTPGVLGVGWTHNFNVLLVNDDDTDSVSITFGDGHTEIYQALDDVKYTSPLGQSNVLARTHTGWKLTTSAMMFHEFNTDGNLQSVSDLNGNKTDFSYDENGFLNQALSPCGKLTFKYSEEAFLTEITDTAGRTVKFEYSGNTLAKAIYPNGSEHKYEYDTHGNLCKLINPIGVETIKNEYDEHGRMIKQTFADNGVYSLDYNDKTTTAIEQNGNNIKYERDDQYRTTKITYSDSEERFEYDDRNNRTKHVDRNGNIRKFKYDNFGNLINSIDPAGHIISTEYNNFNQPEKVVGSAGEITRFEYDPKGNLIKCTDPLQREIHLANDKRGFIIGVTLPDLSKSTAEYDERGNITSITEPDGSKTEYEYDCLNRVARTINGEGRATAFEYNANGDITKVVNAGGDMRLYEYNLSGRVTKITDFDGGEVKYTYNNMGKIEQITDQLGGTTKFAYDLMWNITGITNPCGDTVHYEYDKFQRIIKSIDEEGHSTSYEHDPNGNITAIINAVGTMTEIKYDALDRKCEITEANDIVTRIVYDKSGNVTQVTDALGNVTMREYDLAGQLIKITDPLGNKTEITYTMLGQIERITNAKGENQQLSYYPGGRLKSVTLPLGESETYEYDKNGNVVKITDSLNSETTLVYDEMDRVVETINPLGYSKKFSYDAIGNITSMTDEKGNLTQYKYSLLGDIVEVVDARGSSTKYDYDGNRRMTKLEQYRMVDSAVSGGKEREFQITTYERNKKGEVVAITTPLGSVAKYSYDALGKVTSRLDGEGNETLYEYTLAGNLAKIAYADGKTVELSYNALKQLTSMRDWLGATTIALDELGRTTRVIDYDGNEVGYSWNELSQRERLIYPDGSEVNYEYNESGRLRKVTSAQGITQYDYDAMGRMVKRILPDSTTTSYEINPLGMLTALAHQKDGEILDQFKYLYDPAGNITQIEKQRKNTESDRGIFRYAYDSLGQLVEAEKDGNIKKYCYDELGNRIMSLRDGVETRYSYNAGKQLIKTQDGIETREYSYDKRGNLTHITENGQLKNGYTFDASNLLTGAFAPDKGTVQYTYNGFRSRVKKIEALQNTESTVMPDPCNEVRCVLDMTLPYNNLLMTQGSQNQNFIWGGSLLAATERRSESSTFYLQDHLGSPIRLLGEHCEMLLSYDEFGASVVEPSNREQAFCNPFGFTGYQFNSISDTYFAQAREYDPATSRMFSEDTHWNPGNMIYGDWVTRTSFGTPIPNNYAIWQSGNLYSYCMNNPTSFIDATGEDAILINKRIDAAGGRTPVDHNSIFLQDGGGSWWYFSWEDSVIHHQVLSGQTGRFGTQDDVFKDVNSINEYLRLNNLINDVNFHSSVYVRGDFTNANQLAQEIHLGTYRGVQRNAFAQWWHGSVLGLDNRNYGLFMNNCGQVAMRLLYEGTLPDGTNIGRFARENGYGISGIPNWNMINMRALFLNDATNLSDFLSALQTERERIEAMGWFGRLWNNSILKRLNRINGNCPS